MKGVTLVQGQVVILSLDGSMVYVEVMEPTFAGVVALPEQPDNQTEYGQKCFTPGKVGIKKISPLSQADKVVPVTELTERNKKFIGSYEGLRAAHGPHFVDRTPEEETAYQARMNPPDPRAAKAAKKADRDAAKANKKSKAGPRYLQRCATCGEQSGHPNHPNVHAFEAPPPPAPLPVLCVACDKEAADVTHLDGSEAFTHRFIEPNVGRRVKASKETKPPKEPKEPKAAKPGRPPKADGVSPSVKHRWTANDAAYAMLVSVNPKYSAKNSGGAIVEAIKATGATGASVADVMAVLASHPRWCGVPGERVQFAFKQMLAGQLIEVA